MIVDEWRYPYTPHPKQRVAHKANTDELLFGGAAGPGKTDMLIASAVTLALLVPGSKALILRRTFPQLEAEIIPRLKQRIPHHIARYNEQKKSWTFANGATIRLGHLDSKDAVANYDGGEYQLICWDELTHFDEYVYTTLIARARAGGDVAARMKELGMKPRIIAGTNPGGRGHHWVKARFVDPAPEGTAFIGDDGMSRMYVRALAGDNPLLDEGYYARLDALSPERRKALKFADWNVYEGVRFSQWREGIHVIEPDELPIPILTGKKCVAVDYGFSAPFAALWMVKLHDGLVVVFRELYLKERTATEQAELIRDSETEDERAEGRHRAVVMDPAMWRRNDAAANKTGDKDAPPVGSPAHDYQRVLGQRPVRAINSRVHGWARVDEKLRLQGDDLPRLLVYSTCRELIRTLPALPRDNKNPEDIDTTAEDHLADALRYGLLWLEGKDITPRAEHRVPSGGERQMVTSGLASKQF